MEKGGGRLRWDSDDGETADDPGFEDDNWASVVDPRGADERTTDAQLYWALARLSNCAARANSVELHWIMSAYFSNKLRHTLG
ncbi:hypothetical protein EJ110_NYTH34530 [Nymphaea thermarum]|nr:hypothetical protein EJ110_NYTH34530 [Nymphaea thermarum]